MLIILLTVALSLRFFSGSNSSLGSSLFCHFPIANVGDQAFNMGAFGEHSRYNVMHMLMCCSLSSSTLASLPFTAQVSTIAQTCYSDLWSHSIASDLLGEYCFIRYLFWKGTLIVISFLLLFLTGS